MSVGNYTLASVPTLTIVRNREAVRRRKIRTVIVYDPHVFSTNLWVRGTISRWFDCADFVAVRGGEPTADSIEETAAEVRKSNPNLIVSVGGGSTMDTAKGAAHLTEYSSRLPRQFAQMGELSHTIGHVAIPTTAGPGAEASPAMIYDTGKGLKTARVHNALVPQEVIIIPEIVTTLPMALRAACLMDGIAHSFECLLSRQCPVLAQELGYCTLLRLTNAFPALGTTADDARLQEELALASVLSATSLRLTSVNLVHALVKGLEGRLIGPHSILVALCLRSFLLVLGRVAMEALSRRLPRSTMVNLNLIHSQVAATFDRLVLPGIRKHIVVGERCAPDACAAAVMRDPRWSNHLLDVNKESLHLVYKHMFHDLRQWFPLP